MPHLTSQIAFVGEKYGGVQARFLPHDIPTEAALIANNLYPVLGKWSKVVSEAKPLVEEVPDEDTLGFLLSPFTATMKWGVWASKILHFLRPDAFPILDSNAKKPLGLTSLGGSSRDYYRFCSAFRDVLLANSEALTEARSADNGESPSDLKLLDKILYQLGKHMNT